MRELHRTFFQAGAAVGVLMASKLLRDDTSHLGYLLTSGGHDRPLYRGITIDPYQISLTIVIEEDQPKLVEGRQYSWTKHPLKKLFGKQFEVLDMKTKEGEYKVKEENVRYMDMARRTTDPNTDSNKVARKYDQVTFHYLRYEYEKVVKNTYNYNPRTVRLGKGEVCKGLDIAMDGMERNVRRKIIVPPDLSCRHKLFCRECKTFKVYDVLITEIKKKGQ